MSSAARRNAALSLLAALTAGVLLAAGAGAKPSAARVLTLNPITILNGTATVSGNVASSGATAAVTVNGQPLSVAATGAFAGAVNLGGASALELAVTTPTTGKRVEFRLPLDAVVGPGGVIPASVLDAIEQAGATLLEPAGGFRAVDGHALTIGGTVLDRDQLAGLAVNGKDVLSSLGADQSFQVQVPGTTKEVTLTATDTHGVTETTHYRVLDGTSVIQTRFGPSVDSASAVGLRVATVRLFAKRVARTKRVWMAVVVKDSRGYLVRRAKIVVRAKAPGRLTRRSQAKQSNRVGRAVFPLKVRPTALGKRLVMVTVARTPTAKASKVASARLAKARRASRH